MKQASAAQPYSGLALIILLLHPSILPTEYLLLSSPTPFLFAFLVWYGADSLFGETIWLFRFRIFLVAVVCLIFLSVS